MFAWASTVLFNIWIFCFFFLFFLLLLLLLLCFSFSVCCMALTHFVLSLFQLLCNCSTFGISTLYDESNRIFYVGKCLAAAGSNFFYSNFFGMVHNGRVLTISSRPYGRLYIRGKQNVCNNFEFGQLLDSWTGHDNNVLSHLQVRTFALCSICLQVNFWNYRIITHSVWKTTTTTAQAMVIEINFHSSIYI